MQFTKLRLLGFKSFVDPTEMVIAPGLTGVVGPNGCGKSNLLEALRWVMGESRPTAMRGGGMEDVIFAGAARRPARATAEVLLTLDNSERRAPPAFNDADRLEVVRRITRDAGSAYRVNGKEARARDVQMLFADASTGAQSPALVRQGQIAEIINAKPVARRRVLEEAAGISGLYQRRHEAELKLKGADANLARVDDRREGLEKQFAALARQAKQAARYREIAEALREAEALLLLLRWREAEAGRLAAEAAAREAALAASRAERAQREAGAAREAAAAALPNLREEAAIARAVSERKTIALDALSEKIGRAERAVQHQRRQCASLDADIAREAALDQDAEREVATLATELEALAAEEAGAGDALAAAQDAALAATAALATVETEVEAETRTVAALAARQSAVTRQRSDAAARHQALTKGLEAAVAALAEAEAKAAPLSDEVAAAATALSKAEAAAAEAEAALTKAEAARPPRDAAASEARTALSEAGGRRATLAAEVSALQRLLAEGAGDGTRMLDQMRVSPGFEAALGAALGPDLDAPALAADAAPEAPGWIAWPDGAAAAPPAWPDGVRPLAEMVTAPAALSRRLAWIGVVDANAGPALQPELLPGMRLVSTAGDLWRWDGYRQAAAGAVSEAARRLQQQNRLTALEADLAQAAAAETVAQSAFEAAQTAARAAAEAESAARSARRQAEAASVAAGRSHGTLEAAAASLAGKIETLALARQGRQEEAEAAAEALAEAEAALAALDDLGAAETALAERKAALAAARAAALEAKAGEERLRRAAEARVRRQREAHSAMADWDKRRGTAGGRLRALTERRDSAGADLARAEGEPGRLSAEREALAADLPTLKARVAAAEEALARGEEALRAAEAAERGAQSTAAEAGAQAAAGEARAGAAAEKAEAATLELREGTGQGPEALAEALGEIVSGPAAETLAGTGAGTAAGTATGATSAGVDRAEDVAAAETLVQKLRRQRDALGAVNLRAEEDAAAVDVELSALNAEVEDLTAAIAKLRAAVGALNSEGRARLLAAFERVNRNFGELFEALFGGGSAKLVLVESDDPLEAGLEIMGQPPGKRLSTLSLLSGGEQTLTALSLIFAVFLANPAPICVLDEVDAPLDDANVQRFCDLLDRMTERTATRFMIITHHAITMARMDRLFGVTMAEQGVSQLVSVDLGRAEALASA